MYQQFISDEQRNPSLINQFGGINRSLNAQDGEFSELKNVTYKPGGLIGTREPYKVFSENYFHSVVAENYKDGFDAVYMDDGTLYVASFGTYRRMWKQSFLEDGMEQGDEQIIYMGNRAIIFPENVMYPLKYNSSTDDYPFTRLDATVSAVALTDNVAITLAPCTADGNDYKIASKGITAPEQKQNGDIWIDTSNGKIVYKQWDSQNNMWSSLSTTYVMIKVEKETADDTVKHFFDEFSVGDAVTISDLEPLIITTGITADPFDLIKKTKFLKPFEGDHVIVSKDSNDYSSWIIIPGLLDREVISLKLKVERKVPKNSGIIFECNNRLWTCFYGLNADDEVINQIYASKLGDPKNWRYYNNGISSGSYALPLGEPGAFTGGINFNGYPLFFKEDNYYLIQGSSPATYSLSQGKCRGVALGCEKSLTMCKSYCYYATNRDLRVFDGNSDYCISEDLGVLDIASCVAASDGKQVYFCITDSHDKQSLYVYDTELNRFYEDEVQEYILDLKEDNNNVIIITDSDNRYVPAFNSRFGIYEWMSVTYDEDVKFKLITPEIGTELVNGKYINKIVINAKKSKTTKVNFYISYDGEDWIKLQQTNNIPIRNDGLYNLGIILNVRRSHSFRLKFEGSGEFTLINIYKNYVVGGTV